MNPTDPAEPTVLVVDDNAAARYVTVHALTRAGYRVLEAERGQAALELATQDPALIVLDVNLPDLDGFEVCRRLKTSTRTRHIPVLQVSATYPNPSSMVRGLEEGADGYLTYPVDSAVLVATVRALLRARQAEERTTAILESIGDAFFALDAELRLEYLNGEAERLWGRDRHDLVGQPLEAVWHADWNAQVPATLRAALADRQTRRTELYDAVRDRYWELSVFPSRDGLSVYLRETTERRRAENAVQRLNRTLEQRVEERTAELQELHLSTQAFIYALARDLETPLRQIKSFARLLQNRPVNRDERSARYLENISALLDQLSTQVETLAAFSMARQEQLSLARVDLEVVVREVRKDLERETRGRRVVWNVADLPVLRADPILIQMVMRDLLDNALKFTRDREIAEITLSAEARPDGWTVRVGDNGIGFEPEQRHLLFAPLQRLHGRADLEGSGMGLAQVRRIVQLHGGRVGAENVPGQGALFWFFLPSGDEAAGAVTEAGH
ncbi:PAS domain S-box-containing protein [Deinobacterium chartae]|uniref:histidine kinase n=1 Tax=Deinobacterium chartae TaxID=521158 RepID=A0A841I423_9DEIO|nr:ATP-binding protein [Deinobacterium chartae]MBB6098752.1 PAS domain S-box-containing protein [Deinobacterium chartae]